MTKSAKKRGRLAPDFGAAARRAVWMPVAAGLAAQPSGQAREIIRADQDRSLAGTLLPAAHVFSPSGRPLQQSAYTTGQADRSFVFDVKSRMAVHIRVDGDGDSRHNRQKAGKPVGLPIAVSAPQGMFHHASVVLDDKMGRAYRVVVPFETPVKLLVQGKKLQLDDDKGKPLAGNAPAQTFQVNRSDAGRLLRAGRVGCSRPADRVVSGGAVPLIQEVHAPTSGWLKDTEWPESGCRTRRSRDSVPGGGATEAAGWPVKRNQQTQLGRVIS